MEKDLIADRFHLLASWWVDAKKPELNLCICAPAVYRPSRLDDDSCWFEWRPWAVRHQEVAPVGVVMDRGRGRVPWLGFNTAHYPMMNWRLVLPNGENFLPILTPGGERL
jgi:hypothetical protein